MNLSLNSILILILALSVFSLGIAIAFDDSPLIETSVTVPVPDEQLERLSGAIDRITAEAESAVLTVSSGTKRFLDTANAKLEETDFTRTLDGVVRAVGLLEEEAKAVRNSSQAVKSSMDFWKITTVVSTALSLLMIYMMLKLIRYQNKMVSGLVSLVTGQVNSFEGVSELIKSWAAAELKSDLSFKSWIMRVLRGGKKEKDKT